MFPLLIPVLAGAAGGALLNKKDPLKGALLGGGLAAGGGALPALSGAAGGAASGAAGGGSLSGGLLNFSGAQAAAPIVDKSIPAAGSLASGGAPSGLLDTLGSYAKPLGNIAGAASQANGLLSQGQQPIQAPQLPQYQDMSGLLATAQQNPQLAQLQAQRMKRRGLLGGNYG